MKTIVNALTAVILIYASRPSVLAGVNRGDSYTNIVQAVASGDVGQIKKALVDAEKLWPEMPETYFQCMKEVAIGLHYIRATDPNAKQTLVRATTNLLQRPCPVDDAKAITCFEIKSDTMPFYEPILARTEDQKNLLLALARFIGDVRSRKIPNYDLTAKSQPEGLDALCAKAGVLYLSGAKPDLSSADAATKEAYDKIWKDFHRQEITRRLQSSLVRLDDSLTPLLLQACSRFLASNPTSADFVKEISAAAHLTESERQRLE